MAAICHQKPDRVPKGELHIEGELANRLLGKEFPLTYECFEREIAVRQLLHMDLVNVGEWPQWELPGQKNGKQLIQTVYGQIYEVGGKSQRLIKPAVEKIEDAWEYEKPDCLKVTGEIVKRFAKETDLFVFAQIGGPVTQLDEMFTMEYNLCSHLQE